MRKLKDNRDKSEKLGAGLFGKIPRNAIAPSALVVALLITGWVWFAVRQSLSREDESRFQAEADAAQLEAITKSHHYLSALQSATGLFASSKSVERHEWRQYVGQLALETAYPGISGLGYVENVSAEKLPLFVAETRFFAPKMRIDPKESGPRYLVKFAEPESEYLDLVGTNFAADPRLVEALHKSRSENRPSLASGVTLFQGLADKPGIVVFIPIYQNGFSTADAGAREKSIAGWVFATLRDATFLRELMTTERKGIGVEVYDGTALTRDRLLTTFAPTGANMSDESGLAATKSLAIGSSEWTLRFKALPAFYAFSSNIGPVLAVACGLLISILLYAVILSLVKTESLALALAERMTAALRESEQRFRSMANTAPVLIWTAAADKAFDYVNQVWLEFTGRTSDAELGSGWLDEVHPDDRAKVKEAFSKAYETREEFEIEFNLKRRDGIYRWMVCKGTPRFLPNGSLAGFVGTGTDITLLKMAEEELRRAMEDAEDVSSLKSEFLASVGHNARTLLDGIIGMSNLVLDEDVTSEQEENFSIIRSCATELLSVVNDIMDFVQLEAGQLPVDHSGFQLNDSMHAIGRLVEAQAQKKQQELLVHIAKDVPGALVGDPIRLRQVLINLMANAVRFTPELGGIILRVNKAPQATETETPETGANGKLRLNFTVANSGIGIAAEKKDFIFESFGTTEGPESKSSRARGLGLVVAKRMVEELGGEIRVESKAGIGTAFHFSAVFEQVSGENAVSRKSNLGEGHLTEPASLSPLRVLVVEDNRVGQKLVTKLLERSGHVVTIAENGAEALEKLEGAMFDLVLMDLEMPVMGGIETTARIRNSASSYANVPVVAITAHALPTDEERCYEAGMNGYLTKPLNFSALLATLHRLTQRGTVDAPRS